MWIRKVSLSPLKLLLVGFSAVLVAPVQAVAEPNPGRVCAEAAQLIEAGYLTEARALFKRLPDEAPVPCMAENLQLIDARRAAAAAKVKEGLKAHDAGNEHKAVTAFEAALALERDNAAALAGFPKGLSTEKGDWDAYYRDWLVPLLQLVAAGAVGVVILGALSGLFARLVVRSPSVEWPRAARIAIGMLGGILLVGCGVMLPVYVMFKPFTASHLLLALAVLVILLLLLSVVATVAWVAARAGQSRRRVWADWCPLLVCLAVTSIAGLPALMAVFSESYESLGAVYVVLSCFGVLLTATALGQSLRLQVEVQTEAGEADAAATDYLLARLRTLGMERRQELNAVPAITSLSNIRTEDLSALPAGKVASTVSRLFFSLRPDRTWRARVTSMDANRIAVTLNRNGRHAESLIFSRLDLGLPVIEDEKAESRLRAQLLTGAAAIILVRLSQSHPVLRPGLLGARNWRSVTLQVIASSESLIDAPDQRVPMLGRAVNEDPGNKLARLEYLWAHQDSTSFDSPLARQITEATDKLLEDLPSTDVARALRIRGHYRNTAQWLNMHAQSGYTDTGLLDHASDSLSRLETACKPSGDQNSPVAQLADRARPLAGAFRGAIDALSPPKKKPATEPSHPPHPTHFQSPRLAYENACFECALLSDSRAEQPHAPKLTDKALHVDHAVQHLRVGLPTSRDVELAIKDPSLALLRGEAEFQSLAGTTPPAEFLKLQTFTAPDFAGVAEKLDSAGLSQPEEIIRRTNRSKGRAELATYLGISSLLVDRIRQIALLAKVHPDLGDPRMLNLLLRTGIDSPSRLKKEIREGREELVNRLKKLAETEGTSGLKGIERPNGWLAAGRR
ncbi:DUF4332 domain-containing protein [Streptomyces kanasensis]|uniref:DUF4332 domain-containing protein n=1 Tax=Streptomyces kanasensis TaxID=936756 RepID=UPI0037016411